MRLFLDTEFNGFRGDLLSVGCTDEWGRSFYGIQELHWAYEIDPWVAENVIPVLKHPDVHAEAVSPSELRLAFISFLSAYHDPEIIVDWPSDPWYLFDMLLGQSHLDTYRLKLSVRIVTSWEKDIRSKIHHNALEDARATRNSFLGRVVPEGKVLVTTRKKTENEETVVRKEEPEREAYQPRGE